MTAKYVPTDFETVQPGRDDNGKRIDALLRRLLPELPLARIYRALRSGEVRIERRKVKPAHRVRTGVPIEIKSTLLGVDRGNVLRPRDPQTNNHVESDSPSLEAMILAETAGVLVVNKPRGLLVQGGSDGNPSLDVMVRSYLADRLPASLSFRPGPLHRLDRNTTGIVFFSTSLEGAHRFLTFLRSGACGKYYLAHLTGRLCQMEVWRDDLVRHAASRRTAAATEKDGDGRKCAETRAIPLIVDDRAGTLALCRLSTGRTHQIRAHAAAHGHPLAGDRKYGGAATPSYILHAFRFDLPLLDPIIGIQSVSAPFSPAQLRILESMFPPEELHRALARKNVDRLIARLE